MRRHALTIYQTRSCDQRLSLLSPSKAMILRPHTINSKKV